MLAAPRHTQSDQHLLQPATEIPLRPGLPGNQISRPAAADAMISIMPTPRPLTPKRPKLSLQTSTISTLPASKQSRTALSNLSSAADSPTTYRNTYENAFEATPSTPVSAKPHPDEAFNQFRQVQRPSPQTSQSSSSISTASSGPTSPFANTAPYTVALGARSILRNSPLPRRHTTNLSNRPPKRLFHPMKRVSFPETLVEMIPTPFFSDSDLGCEGVAFEETSVDESAAASDLQKLDELDKVMSTPGPGRRKRRDRDWISRPVEEDASPTQANDLLVSSSTPPSSSLTHDSRSPPMSPEREEPRQPTQ
ncbi:MAG: hypothetical protein L6R40_005523 [Gallowayella cf. fulva]|nr:MAG: hypothetical protein L6R40_005523 [Xanthomendoza cf. fulva]